MNGHANSVNDVTFEQVFLLAQQLPASDQARLVTRLTPQVEMALLQLEEIKANVPRKPLRGLLADLGAAPSAAEIDEVQREMWASLAQE